VATGSVVRHVPSVESAWADLIDPPELAWKADPVRWARDRAGITLWSMQKQIIETVRDNPQTAVHSCHEIGKSFIAAMAACWWIDVHPPGTAFVVTTAPTGPQVEAILWREINRIHARAGLRGRTNLTEWYLGRELVAYGRKPSEYNPSAFQGVHARYFLVILDEACGIPKSLWDSASTLAANEYGRQLAIGNPDDPHGEFADNCRPDSGWEVIHVGYEMTPNFTDEGKTLPRELTESLIHPSWVEGRRKKWGENSALFVSKCRGLFPVDADAGVIPYSWLTACRYLEHPQGSQVEAGVDVGGGGDRTIVRERRGTVVGREAVFIDNDPMRTVGRIAEVLRDWGVQRVKVDSTGIGWGIYGRLRELSTLANPVTRDGTHNAEVVAVNFAESSSDPKQFLNRRAELWWLGRELSRLRAWDTATLDDDTVAELTEPHYEIMDSSGKIKIEKKDDVIKRLGRSPDSAEALLLAFLDKRWELTTSPAAQDLTAVNLTRGLGVF
jgi:hypothetical protein